MHEFLANSLSKLIREHSKDPAKKTPVWFTTEQIDPNSHFEIPNFDKQTGDKGFIPKELKSTLRNLNISEVDHIAKRFTNITHAVMHKKWKIKRRNIYHPELDINELITKATQELTEFLEL